MKTQIIATFVACAALATFSQSSFAEGGYLLGSIGSSIPSGSAKTDLDTFLISLGATKLSSSMSNGTAIRLGAGYQISPNVAIEGAYVDTGTMTYSATATGATITANVKATGLQAGLIGIAPINTQVSLLAKLTYASYTIKSDALINTTGAATSKDEGTSGYGFGGMYKLSDAMSLRAEWEKLGSDTNAVTVGVQMRF